MRKKNNNINWIVFILIGLLLLGLLITILPKLINRKEYFSGKMNYTENFAGKIEDLNKIYEFDNFLSSEECDKIIELSKNSLETSEVYIAGELTRVDKDHRESEQKWWNDEEHPVFKKLSNKVANIVGLPVENQEALQVVKYSPGGYFKEHYDPLCTLTKEECAEVNGTSGPRFATFLVYLNDVDEGGDTCFTKINKCIKPKKGKAVLFYSTDHDEELIHNSMHTGSPVTKGDKWVCNKWIHHRKFV